MRRHQPVMLQETLDALPQQCTYIMDGTLGHAGHTVAMLQTRPGSQVVGVDRDEAMIAKANIFLEEAGLVERVNIVQGSYADFTHITQESDIKQFDMMLIDIGVNMDHFKEADRGFSLKRDGELDMRYDRSCGISASVRLERAGYDDCMRILHNYTDFGQKLCDTLVKELLVAKNKTPFTTTQELREWANKIGLNDKKLAVFFQAIRIEVNGELEELKKFLQLFPNFLISGGRCAVMTYHSIEDRMVKQAFKEIVDAGEGILVNKKVITPHRQEVKKNKAARSAKLRIFEKN